jgi:hypothetical protein
MCHSPSHALSVPLILNTQSGNVLPQFHCIYDDEFATCKRDVKFKSLWQFKVKFQSKLPQTDLVDKLPTLPPPGQYNEHNINVPIPPPALDPVERFVETWDPVAETPDNVIAPTNDMRQSNEPAPAVETVPNEAPATEPAITTRAGRRILPRNRLIVTGYLAISAYLSTFSLLPTSNDSLHLLQPDIEAYAEPRPFALMTEHVTSFIAQSDPDTMHLEEALRQPDREEFIKAMKKELNDHIDRKHWKVIPASAVPKHKVPIPMVWSMKRKRNPIREIIKWKARLCARGHRSLEYVDYWSTYSPVVSWNTVRLVIVMALLNDWLMQSIDFVLAFPQAPIKTDIYMKPPQVPAQFDIPDLPSLSDQFTNVYNLLRNLYGLKDAGRTWFEFLKKGLLHRGWKQSTIDGCLFTKDGILLVIYVQDAILISPDKTLIKNEIKSLQKDYDLTDDSELEDYLETRFTHKPNGSIELSQPRMIERVLHIVGLDPNSTRTKLHDTPASNLKILDNDPNALPREQKWNY